MEDLKTALTCCICMEVSTLPVHSLCCESAKSLPPACMTCVRSYLDLNQPFHNRQYSKKSWAGCGCNIYPQQKASDLYTHTVQLDSIRNLIGPSVCHHEQCKAVCSTAAELRRHLNGSGRNGDERSFCQYATTKCKHCSFIGVRHVVEGEHYREVHDTLICPLCVQNIPIKDVKNHYNKHARYMKTFLENIQKKNIDIDDGIIEEL
jgi:hypothetical protein